MTTINPYLAFNGHCEEAFNFYKSVFGGDFIYIGRFKDMPSKDSIPPGDMEKIMHIALPISKETMLMGSDSSEAFGRVKQQGDNISISINTGSEKEATRIFKELSQGGKITMPLDKSFWGSLFGMFTDKFGIHWMVSYDYEEM